LEKIEGLVDQWQQKAARPEIAIGKRIATNLIDAEYLQTLLANGVGKVIMDNIRSLCDEMIANFRRTGNEDGVVLSISIAKDMVDMEAGQRGFIITGKEEFLEPYLAGQKRLKEHISKLRSLLSDDERSLTALAKVKSLASDWFEKAAGPEINARQEMNRHPETLKDAAVLLEAGTGKNILDQIREEFKKFIKIEEGLTKSRYVDASGNAGHTRNIIIIFLIASIIFGGVVALLISRGIINSIRELSDAVGMVAKGDLTHEVKVMTKDEIGQLAVDFNQMVKDLRRLDKNEKHLNAVLRAIRNVDKLITKEKDRDRLLQGACDALIETRGFYSAWVIILDESKNIVTTAEAGFGKSFQAITERLKPGELPRCGNTTLGQSGVLITENQAPYCADCPFGSITSIENSVMTIRLAYEEKIYGLFCASVPKEFVMDGEEKFLFKEVADDIAFALYSIDMNERRRHAETKLASAHSQLKNVMDASRQVSIIATDPKGLIKVFNTGAEKMLGYSAEEVTEKQTPAIFHVESEISAHSRKLTEELGRPIEGFEVFVARARKGDYEEREWTYIKKDGTRLTVNLSVTAVYDAANQVSGFLGIAMDVTERNQARIQLQKALDGAESARSRINNILQSITDGLIVTDPEDRIILLNPAAENMLGIPLKTSTGLSLIDLVKDKNLQKRLKEAFKTRTGGFSFDFESTGEMSPMNVRWIG
ncbi:MAG: CHASE3 domain-containing protein, partial [Deltaproteobacteria bacterium]|nr:CHASE3 domain-containing protein [Deltaproteobacteria bacterium]